MRFSMIRLFYLLVITSLAGLTLYNLTLFKWNVKTKVQFSMGRKLDVPVNTRLWSKTPSEHPEEGKVLTEDSSTKNTSQSHTDLQTRIEIINLNSSKKAEVQLKKILAWTPLTAKKPVWGIKPYSFNKCEYDNCIATGNRSELDSADLLLFRVRALKRDLNQKDLRQYVYPVDVVDLPPVHKPKQMWAYINQESPVYTLADEEVSQLNNQFDVISNYLFDSDYPLSYIPLVIKKAVPETKRINYAHGKTKMAAWFVSHCNASSGRDQYVKELQKYISVDVFGRCSGVSDGCTSSNLTCHHELRRPYKFYLAFENSICTEYITEKFWDTLNSDAYNVPIGLGASLQEYEKFAPPNSYLHSRNFSSVKALADLMIRLDSNDTEYNEYHGWRATHELKPRPSIEPLYCFYCRMANEKKPGNPKYRELSTYWSRKKQCELSPEPIK